MELIAKRYKLEHDKVQVIADHVGGGFGSKASLGVETTTAIELARAAKAPVRIAYDRHEELSVTGYRPATEVKIALLPSEQGASESAVADRLCRHRCGDQLHHRGAGAADLSGGGERTRRLRRHQQPAARRGVPRARRTADGVRAGTGDRRSRAADEGRSDRACANAGIPIPTAERLYDWALGLDVWRNRKIAASQTGRYRRGVGVATGYWLYLWQPGSKVEVSVKGGRLIASTATQDIGTGSRTVIANTVAREFGLEPHEIEVRIGDSRSAGRTGIGRQPRHGLGDSADAARRFKSSRPRSKKNAKAKAGRRAPTRHGARCWRPRPISPPPACGRRTARRWRRASNRR